ncbi:MAG: PspC domain-containing protein [Bacillota bacterium]|nr:PspC domain-containing protein [Bacillota bacterium]
MEKRLYRSKRQRMLGGVAGGLAEYLNTDPTLIRLLLVLLALPGAGLVFYVVAWIIMPEEA